MIFLISAVTPLCSSSRATCEMIVATIRLGQGQGWFTRPAFWLAAVIVLAALFGLSFFGPAEKQETEKPASEPFDAFAGGYPVPPRAGQQLPELSGVLPGGDVEDEPGSASGTRESGT